MVSLCGRGFDSHQVHKVFFINNFYTVENQRLPLLVGVAVVVFLCETWLCYARKGA